MAQTLGHELSKRSESSTRGFVVFWDYGWNSTFDLVCFMAMSAFPPRAWRVV